MSFTLRSRLISDLSSFLLCLEQSYGSTAVVVIIFPNTKILEGEGIQHLRRSPLLFSFLMPFVKNYHLPFTASFHSSTSGLGRKLGNFQVFLLLVLENLEVGPGQAYCGGWLGVRADKKQGGSDAVLG